MIWIENGIRDIESTVKVGHMTPPRAAISVRSQQELTLKTIEGQIRCCLLGPRQRRMIHRMITPCGKEGDSNQYWKQAASSGDQWRPRLRSEAEMSSVAGDTSDASAAVPRLNSINENERDAVRDSRSDARYRVVTPFASSCTILNDISRFGLILLYPAGA